MTKLQRYFAECLGTAGLLGAVIGSGVMAQNLANCNIAIALIANTLATVFALFVLIEIFGPISGAHFNPVVSIAMFLTRQLHKQDVLGYITAQLVGAAMGAWLVHAMFDLTLFQWASKVRSGPGQWLAEIVATCGLLLVIFRGAPNKVSTLVASYIGAAYWFTASTSFANPAAAFGRMLSDTFAGIRPGDVPAFVAAQLIGMLLAVGLHRFFSKPAYGGFETLGPVKAYDLKKPVYFWLFPLEKQQSPCWPAPAHLVIPDPRFYPPPLLFSAFWILYWFFVDILPWRAPLIEKRILRPMTEHRREDARIFYIRHNSLA